MNQIKSFYLVGTLVSGFFSGLFLVKILKNISSVSIEEITLCCLSFIIAGLCIMASKKLTIK